MKIQGLQKMTLLDFPGRVACTVFLGGCDFRCPFCHNGELLDGSAPAVMDDQELLRFLKGRQGLLDGVAITGGEPLLRKDLPELLRAIRELGFGVKVYALTVGLESLDLAPIRRSVKLLMDSSIPYEFRTTVVDELHKAADFEAMGRWIAGAKAYFLQPFTDRDSVPFAGLHAPTRENLEKYASMARVYVPYTSIRGL